MLEGKESLKAIIVSDNERQPVLWLEDQGEDREKKRSGADSSGVSRDRCIAFLSQFIPQPFSLGITLMDQRSDANIH